MEKEEQTYWWHITRRAILESILNRFKGLLWCHPERNGSGVEGSPPLACLARDSSTSPTLGVAALGMTKEQLGMTNKQVRARSCKILDVGCGTGVNFAWLNQFGEVMGADTSELAITIANRKGTAVLGRAEDLPFEDNTLDLVTAFDVLEHIADEKRVLGEWGRVLRPRGLLFVSVPAYQWLFGPHDRALEHLRRYNVPQLKRILSDNDFNVIFASHFFALTFPIFLLQRFWVRNMPIIRSWIRQNNPSSPPLNKGEVGWGCNLQRLTNEPLTDKSQYVNVPKWLNNFLISLGRVEAGWLKFGRFPFGSSIVVLARKIDQPRNI